MPAAHENESAHGTFLSLMARFAALLLRSKNIPRADSCIDHRKAVGRVSLVGRRHGRLPQMRSSYR
jgi:hypothetical protein